MISYAFNIIQNISFKSITISEAHLSEDHVVALANALQLHRTDLEKSERKAPGYPYGSQHITTIHDASLYLLDRHKNLFKTC